MAFILSNIRQSMKTASQHNLNKQITFFVSMQKQFEMDHIGGILRFSTSQEKIPVHLPTSQKCIIYSSTRNLIRYQEKHHYQTSSFIRCHTVHSSLANQGFGQNRHHSEHGSRSGLGYAPVMLCFLGFTLRQLLGEEEDHLEEQQDQQLILMIKQGILAFHVSNENNLITCFDLCSLQFFYMKVQNCKYVIGGIFFQHGEFDLSESLLHVALKAAQEVQHEQAITYIFDVLANLSYQRGHYDTAEALFKSVMKRHVAGG